MTAAAGWRRLSAALAARSAPPPLVPDRPWAGSLPLDEVCPGPSEAQRLAAAVIGDRPREALAAPASTPDALQWRAVALRRAGHFQEARRTFRALGPGAAEPRLFEEALDLLRAGGPGFRWANEAAAHLTARGGWDPVWFVDACAAACAGLLSRETAALLEEIQRVELELLLRAGAAGQS